MSPAEFDREVVPEALIAVARACQRRAPDAHLGGGAALSGVFLRHRRTRDLDLFVHDAESHRVLVAQLPVIASETGVAMRIVRDGGAFVRAQLDVPGLGAPFELDLVHEPQRDLAAPFGPIEGVLIESLDDLRASKVTCLLSRSEPRDLVDLLFLERAGFRVEDDLPLALRKDAGIDPGTLAWLLTTFRCAPLPLMLKPLEESELQAFRDELAMRLRRMSVPEH